MLDGMLDENLSVGWAVLFIFARSHPTLSSNILKTNHSSKIQNGGHTCTLNELVVFDDEKPHRGKIRLWVKRRSDWGYFNNIIKVLRIEDRTGFRDIFRMDVADFEYILTQISDLLSPKHRLDGNDPIKCNLRLAITLQYLATGVSFQSSSYQFRIPLNAVSYIVKV